MTINLRLLLIFCVILFVTQASLAQFGFAHEVGVIAGPVQFRSDFGQRFNEKNNMLKSLIFKK